MKIPHTIVVEEEEYELYKKHNTNEFVRLLILDKKYQEEYNTLDTLGLTKSVGPGAARNFIWDHSIKKGYDWHWVMDDNIDGFYRFHNNRLIRVGHSGIFEAMEDFCLRYTNVGMAGPNYQMFIVRRKKYPPFILNTRIYSCNLIRNDIPYRWRGRYNEDTILSLDMLSDGWCTIQFNALLQNKLWTQTKKGGNTKEFYAKEGTLPKSKMLVKEYPHISKLTYKFNRWHHEVNYRVFKYNKLRRKKGLKISKKNNEYGMKLKKIKKVKNE